MYAKVIIDIKHEQVNQAFDYHIPDDMINDLEIGMRVIVPFGAQTRMAYVIEIMEKSSEETKDIMHLLDLTPTVNDELFMIINDILEKTHALYSEVFECVIPSELGMDYDKEIIIKDPDLIPESLKSYFNEKGIWHLKKGDYDLLPKLRRLREKKAVDIKNIYAQKTSEKKVVAYLYNENHQYQRIDKYPKLESDKLYIKNDLEALGFTIGHIQTLKKHDVLIQTKSSEKREIKHVFDLKDKIVSLTSEQHIASQTIKDQLEENQTFLLHGVTGSGKTEVYLDVMEKVISEHKKCLILVPEITLVSPMAKRLKSRFNRVAIYHSALSKGERYDQYQMILNDEVDVVIATRSGVFMPINDLGIIIIDEEHDQSYIQNEGVIYDARHIASLRAKYHHIPLVLGSATPSIESMYHAKNNTYHYIELNHRPFDLKQPSIKLIDMKSELKQKNTSIFSNDLKEAIKDRLSKKEQIMILFNRKGYAPFVLCRHCGDVPKCPDCDISLTYYKDKEILKCHYCGYEKHFSNTCEACSQPTVKEVGVGIEYVEQQLKKTFPAAKIMRMDKNVTTTKGAHEKLWHSFLNEDADILLGTQMIAKGLDFPKVTLVGVLMADLSLKVPSYTASEQTYMLLSQISGRSGRHLPGEVIIQGYQLDHYAIQSVLKDYESFYKEALYERKLMRYEPFMHVSQFLIEGIEYLKTYQIAFQLKKKLSVLEDVVVLGPSQALIKKIRDRFRFVVTIKYKTLDFIDVENIMNDLKTHNIYMKYYPNLDMM